MHMTKVSRLLLVLLCCELCSTIKVPVTWKDSANSEVKNDPNAESPADIINPHNVQTRPPNQQPIPIEYFEYTAQKPKFAADIAAFHGVKNPQQHYKAYPVQPYTGKQKPVLGVHHLLDQERPIFHPFQSYVEQNGEINRYVHPTSSGYEIFHPYKAEEPALQEIYKDPILTKIRNDIHDSKTRLQAYEQEAGEPHIAADEYLESPEKTDSKLFPQKNEPAPYEIHRPQRRPVYYRAPTRDHHRDHLLNKKFRHPWNQQNVKIRPLHYRPLHNHIGHLRQQHAIKYDDERNEYPQFPVSENIENTPEGYDIYEKGKQKYTQLKNNLDESINNIVQKHRPANYQTLELQNNNHKDEEVEEEFVPVKNYAQVRKTETFKHVPKKSAFDDAETYEEILNAPRLREAVKSTKAQTVYSEEGYEDSAYDHAGEQKHASDQEGHGGFLKEHENSGGLYKIPSVAGKYQDGKGSEYRDNTEHGKKWNNSDKDEEEETEAEDYSEIEHDESVEADIYKGEDPEVGNRDKREGEAETETETNDADTNDDAIGDDDIDSEINSTAQDKQSNNSNTQHEVDKRQANFIVPEIDLNSTLTIKTPTSKRNEQKNAPILKTDYVKDKYPYYFKNLKGIHKNSPLRYAENLRLIPRKSKGGTEFYDSRSKLQCSEVDGEVDPLPEKLKNGENPTEEDNDDDTDKSKTKESKGFDSSKQVPRLEGLGDKIDCFKAKYFGENPLDSPFFKEEIISNPEPIFAPKLSMFQIKNYKGEGAQESKINKVISATENLRDDAKTNIFDLLNKLRSDQNNLHESFNKSNVKLQLHASLNTPINNMASKTTVQTDVYSDILKNINNIHDINNIQNNSAISKILLNSKKDNSNLTYNSFQNKEDVTKMPPNLRKKRATPFVYEPYKIIRDGQVQDSKKTTTTSNISPLIKQLQSSGVADRVSRSNRDDKLPKKSFSSRTYVDIGRKDRAKPLGYNNSDATFVDVSIDQRRGEPRYELRPSNHKTEYTPVENKKAMSIVAYNSQKTTERSIKNITPTRGRQRFRSTLTTVRPVYDVAQFIPKIIPVQNVAASNSVKKTVNSAPDSITKKEVKQNDDSEEVEESEEYVDDDDEEEEEEELEETTTTTTTTTTLKPSFRRRTKVATTTEKIPEHNTESEAQLLKLVTRFRNYKLTEDTEPKVEVKPPITVNKNVDDSDIAIPKYREKKKKSHTSTIVTDSNKYGNKDEEEDMEKEVDALIGVRHDMKDYMPMYEKEEENKDHQSTKDDNDNSEEEEDNDSENDDEDDDDNDSDYNDDEEDDEDDDEDETDDKKEDQKTESEVKVTTPEPTKRTLIRTTDAPPSTTATFIHTSMPTMSSRIVKPEGRPIVTRKKIEIHKELPVNKSSPHITQFKQDIKEVEIIREIPTAAKRKQQKNTEVLNLYKDDNLAKEVNKLGDIEVFRENLNLNNGPKHGGNYRKATKEDLRLLKPRENTSKRAKDAETSQSETSKHVELEEFPTKRLHGGNLKSLRDAKRSRNSGISSKLIELSDQPVKMHGGNLKFDKDKRNGRKSEKLIEIDDDEDDHSYQDDKDYKPLNTRNERMHGGNYRSAKLIAPKESDDIQVKSSQKESTRNAALLLAQFAQAAPILTSTPAYILDPSKRMYYYVDA